VGEPFRVVHVLVARQAAVDRLPDQIGEWELRVLAPRIGDVLRDQIADGGGLPSGTRPLSALRRGPQQTWCLYDSLAVFPLPTL